MDNIVTFVERWTPKHVKTKKRDASMDIIITFDLALKTKGATHFEIDSNNEWILQTTNQTHHFFIKIYTFKILILDMPFKWMNKLLWFRCLTNTKTKFHEISHPNIMEVIL